MGRRAAQPILAATDRKKKIAAGLLGQPLLFSGELASDRPARFRWLASMPARCADLASHEAQP